ncbi:helix-turn-helix domain-containing protein [Corynebacterium glyciniphilum]|uniref:helix-turn-helix domain-containing protein n=1 Tax=Corynebacterium glyciniphilum TaxID=1404244 RepID=UPI0011AB6F12|nr:helix-turn-helix domain-containing protein [Corynebacterium glyciniphilum]
MPELEKKLYSIEEAMEATSLGRTTLFALVRDGKIRSVKIGRRRMISAAALDEFIAGLEGGQSDTQEESPDV